MNWYPHHFTMPALFFALILEIPAALCPRTAYYFLAPLAYCLRWLTYPLLLFTLSFCSSCIFCKLVTMSIRPHTSYRSGDITHILIATPWTSNLPWFHDNWRSPAYLLVHPYQFSPDRPSKRTGSPPDVSHSEVFSSLAGRIWYSRLIIKYMGWQISYFFSIHILCYHWWYISICDQQQQQQHD